MDNVSTGIQINWIFNIDIDIANFEKSILILKLAIEIPVCQQPRNNQVWLPVRDSGVIN